MGLSFIQRLAAKIGPEKLGSVLTEEDIEELRYLWRLWARPEQITPPGDWRVWLALAGRGWGKLLQRNCKIPTPEGWRVIGEINPGDFVISEMGFPCRVTATYDEHRPSECFELRFSDDSTIVACGDHQWVTWTHAERKAFLRSPYEDTSRFPENWPQWKLRRLTGGTDLPEEVVLEGLRLHRLGLSARKIEARMGVGRAALAKHFQAGQFVSRQPKIYSDSPGPQIRTTREIVETLTYGKRGDLNHCIPCAGSLQLPAIELPVDPYVLGYWLGDGSQGSGSFTCDREDQSNLEQQLVRAGFGIGDRKCPKTVGALGLHTELGSLGVLRNKHVPSEYLRASAEQRLALLQGLMDSDGFSASYAGVVEFSAKRKTLARAVFELAASLGQKPRLHTGRALLEGVDHGEKYRVRWRPTIQVFRLPRKADRLKFDGSQSLRNHHRMIVDARRVDSEPMRCLTVDSPNNMFLCGDSMIPTHNSRTGAEFIREQVENGRAKHIALVGETAADARDVMVELSESSITKISPPWFRPKFEPTKRRLVWPNGAVATVYSGDDPDQLRGPQHDLAWLDELAKYRYPRQTWDNLMFGLRQLGPDGTEPRILVTTTPRPTPLVIELAKGDKQYDGSHVPREDVIVTGGSSWDNRGNLAKAFLTELNRYEGTRLGRQEIHREILDESEGALWSHALIDEHRVNKAPDLDVVVVAVDPMTSEPDDVNRKDKRSGPPPETGIVVAGRAGDHIFVVGDSSVSDSPKGWAERAIRSWKSARADRMVGEKNQGGAMVKHTIHSVDPDVPVSLVHASRGKKTRAEPVSSLYEQGRVHHVGVFPRLEDQMTTWVPGSKSPDRMDALVWAVTDLLLKGNATAPSVGVRVIG